MWYVIVNGISLVASAATFPNHFTTNAVPLLRTVFVTDFGAKGDGVTDDTAAFQTAIDSLTNSGVGGVVMVPDGVYFIDASFTESAGAKSGLTHSQIHLPVRDLINQTICPITIRGLTQPTMNTVWNSGSLPVVNTNGAIILSTRIPADPSYTIIGSAGPTASSIDLTAVYLRLENLTFRTYDNPQTSPLNLQNIGQVSILNCTVDTGTPGGQQTQPTHTSVGIVMPKNNNWVVSEIYNVDVRGYDIGYVLNEHSDVDDARVWMCNYGWQFPGGTHGIHIGNTVTTGCPQGVIGGAPGFVQRITWDLYEVEHSALPGGGAWANTVADFADTNSTLRGNINFASVLSGVGATDTLTVNSTTNVLFFNANSHAFTGNFKIQPLVTNDSVVNPSFTIVRSNGVDVAAIGQAAQTFEYFSQIWLGPSTFDDAWQRSTNFSLMSNGTNQTILNAPQPEGGTAVGSFLNLQIGHQTKASISNNVATFSIPIQHGFIATSNYTSGKVETNLTLAPLSVKANVALNMAAVAGASAMQLWVFGLCTNSVAQDTLGTTLANTNFFQLSGDIPAGSGYVFTNTSTGSGNSSTLFKAEVKGD